MKKIYILYHLLNDFTGFSIYGGTLKNLLVLIQFKPNSKQLNSTTLKWYVNKLKFKYVYKSQILTHSLIHHELSKTTELITMCDYLLHSFLLGRESSRRYNFENLIFLVMRLWVYSIS